ncbi:MAG: NADH dehydrogenase [Stygiobacter sp. RIFOXYC12_FULL_38_8]|nr:MAG: NADH dehydrogenase [Stygiobacter sp. GWC2_38_9]OGU80097.1 MAG: NADH dehydrogenase [Stygiobacter sp. RIFOXYA12_FULL_38_9]OGV06040.1 MAG: NADH dehydrogenase [Stygiobacter sp. RIFOXYB2_FULL_37_11]OGV13101.1 MAG: NADH dehydrogenase [Stygiobacter sp. RIFOXYA2_FULL_38_8]OGV16896.1 MAG: NADH dehydrogenase [Stygiobacter sp. RIFOXYC2_FULL_38_25]OGV25429.1 MAG: NADH dehydrogenase [Stygiobacter sp. RIFOXYC12_FULL_38_8]OGV82753.1 MAG: NADH dehydrogenase [Stygiobacter sp. GWF2_38_21]
MNLVQKIFDAGVVGAGGAGFPTHVKAKSSVEFVLANGAECEPLIHKDFELMCNFPDEIVNGVELMTKQTSAKKAYFGIKAKNVEAVDEIEKRIKETKTEMCLLGDFYPSGDEYELVYAATKRLIPPHGLPLDVGCVVNNVETFYNISRAIDDKPVTQKFISVAGCVKKPSSFFVPIGTSFQELLNHAGGSTVSDYGIFVSGILMGKLTFDLTEVVTKTTSGIIILPKEHYLINRMERPKASMNRIGKSACDQCSYCTEFCPRYLLGYDVQPHKVMRSLVFSTSGEAVWNQYADLCCSCGLCSLYSCPEDLYPREACDQGKAELKKQGMIYEQLKPVKVHPIKEGRRVPLKQLMKRIDVLKYDNHTPYVKESPKPTQVKILLKQHVGVAAKPVIKLGAIVNEGTLIADIEEGKLGSRIHASISGKVTHVSEEFIRITG